MDETLIENARHGNREAQAALLAELQDPWFRLCLGLLGQAEHAREATQESALRFLRDLKRFRGESSIRTWAMGIAINVAREMRRKNRLFAQTDAPFDGQPPDSPAAPSGGAENASRSEERDAIHAALACLPERQREAVVLRFFEDLSIDEAAAAMNCAPGTVKATVHQACGR